ncbi:RDD family protein [Bacillus sp. IB182487]|uniref:RDD family protein n=2 Tax=Metabacillus arenae TaxID=2771434 RepID=A0A926NGQ1_9BACI|nr:RDD family protein [Metabacillus arenae]
MLGLIFIIPSMLLMTTGNPEFNTIVRAFLYLIIAVGSIFYFGMMPASKHQGTLGKRIMGLKIVDENGNRVKAGKSWLRYIGYIPSGILYIGFIMIAFTDGKRGLHDMIANTYVVKAAADSAVEPNSHGVKA